MQQQNSPIGSSSAHVHKLVASVAVNCAAELYETMMGDDAYYAAWKRRFPGASPKALARKFVEANWGRCIPVARATLARLLADPTIAESHKATIMEALELDASLMKGRQQPMRIVGTTSGSRADG